MKESKNNQTKIIGVVLALISILAICAIHIFAPVCSGLLELKNGNMIHMRCFYTSQAATYLAIILLICSIVDIFTNKNTSLVTFVIGIMLITITVAQIVSFNIGIGVCQKSTMACIKTAKWLRGCGIITIILSIVQWILANNTKKNNF